MKGMDLPELKGVLEKFGIYVGDGMSLKQAQWSARYIHESMQLRALQNSGVDNWEWYSEAFREAGLFNDDEDIDEEDLEHLGE